VQGRMGRTAALRNGSQNELPRWLISELRLLRLLRSSAADPPKPLGLRLCAVPLTCHGVAGRPRLTHANYPR
jgi:hypothetical protein